MWIALKAPLTLTTTTIDTAKLRILLNDDLIALNQDPLRKQVSLIRRNIYADGTQDIWGAQLSRNRLLLVFINAMGYDSPIEINLKT